MIKIKVNRQLLIPQFSGVVADSIKFLTACFETDGSWDGYTIRAIFKPADGSEAKGVIMVKEDALYLGNNTCFVPFEVIKAPGFSVSICGNKGDSFITTDEVFVPVKESGFAQSGTPLVPTPDEYAQIIAIVNEIREVAQSVRDDADNGVFSKMQVDRSFNGESEFAQSGIAVAQAIGESLGDINTVLSSVVDGSF